MFLLLCRWLQVDIVAVATRELYLHIIFPANQNQHLCRTSRRHREQTIPDKTMFTKMVEDEEMLLVSVGTLKSRICSDPFTKSPFLCGQAHRPATAGSTSPTRLACRALCFAPDSD